MAVSAAEWRALAIEMIEFAGVEAGSGQPLTGVILRQGAEIGTSYPRTRSADQEFACTLYLETYDDAARDGTKVTNEDVKVVIAPDAETDPRVGDHLRVAGRTYCLMMVEALQPGGVVLMWTCQARAS